MRRAGGGGGRREPRSGRPVGIGEIVDDLMRSEVLSRGMPIAELASRWPSIVGERLAGETAPLTLDDGVLVVGVSNGPWGAQARFLQQEIRGKADEALGGGAVRSVRFVVRDASSGPAPTTRNPR
jgi:predicted nucleic acid-binding Zn ribbon protein